MNIKKANEIIPSVKRIIKEQLKVYDKIAKTRKYTFKNVIHELSYLGAGYQKQISELTFPSQVSTDKDIRNSSRKAMLLLSEFNNKMAFRMDIYEVILNVEKTGLNKEELKLLNEYLKGSKKIGLHLNKKTRNKIQQNSEKISKLALKYSENLNEDKTYIILKTSELKGINPDFLKRTAIDKDKHKITMSYPDVFPIMSYVENGETRKKVQHMFLSRCKENVSILDEVVKLRRQQAKLLGYDNYTESVIDNNMINNTVKLNSFLKEIKEKLQKYSDDDLEKLRKYNKKINSWDLAYFQTKYISKHYDLDIQVIKEYFQIDYSIKQIFTFFKGLFDITINEVETKHKWHEDVMYFEVLYEDVLIGHFYMDLFAREGKYGHAAVSNLISSYVDRNGVTVLPLALLMTNFTKYGEGVPSLLTYDEVMGTLLHELGHVLHLLCSRSTFYEFSGLDTAIDFVEAPSQMLEQFGKEKDVIKMFSKHYKTGKPMTDETISKIIASSKFGRASNIMKTVFYSIMDQIIHQGIYTMSEILTLWNKIEVELLRIPSPKDTYQMASWGHLVGGYGGQYYSYIWTKIIAINLYSKFENYKDKKTGKKYVETVLQAGAKYPEKELLHNFLRRYVDIGLLVKSL